MNYTIIKNRKQYDEYCIKLMKLDTGKPSKKAGDEIELLELLIDNWEAKHFKTKNIDPIQLLKSLMDDHKLTRNDLIDLLGIGKSALSQILSYQKGLSKEVIRKLAVHFKLSQDAFNQEYTLRGEENKGHAREKKMNTRKTIKAA
jgi:HTH-type transcriptional regulator/antitoxin HigA